MKLFVRFNMVNGKKVSVGIDDIAFYFEDEKADGYVTIKHMQGNEEYWFVTDESFDEVDGKVKEALATQRAIYKEYGI